MANQAAEIIKIDMELDINCPPDQLWAALTENIGQWWPADFYAGGEDGKRRFSLEAQPGGRMFETWDNGGGVLWGTVVCVDPNVRLQVLGSLFPNWGGPTSWYGTWELTPNGDGTTLRFSESAIGKISDAGAAE